MRSVVTLAFWLGGCAAQVTAPVEIGKIYGAEIELARDLLPSTVLVPGVLGSRIVDEEDGQVYWGAVFGQAPNPAKDLDDLEKLALPITGDAPLVELRDGLTADAVLHVVSADTPFGPMQLRGYPGILEGIATWLVDDTSAKVSRVKAEDALAGRTGIASAPYDWRLDLVACARRLAADVDQAVAARKAATGDARIDIVGHSMGSLVVRWYLMYGTADLRPDGSPPRLSWAGAENVRNVALVAPPSAGSPLVLSSLVEGEKVSSFLPRYPAALVGTFPSMYVMMPRVRHEAVVWGNDHTPVDIYDVAEWEKFGWGMFALDQDPALQRLLPDAATREARVEGARHWVGRALERASHLQAALDADGPPPDHLRMHLFAGDSRPTPSQVEVDRVTGQFTWVAHEPGDGRVTRRSALLDERTGETHDQRLVSPIPWDTVHMGGGEHFDIVRDPAFLDGLLYLLLEDPRSAP